MELWLTNGLFGEKTEKLVETDCSKTVFERIFEWKNDERNRRAYRVRPYNRMIFDPARGETAVDFGDYSTFMLIAGTGARNVMEDCRLK